MKHILFYGNCQTNSIKSKLNLSNCIKHGVVCWETNISKDEFTSLIKQSDVIVTQPIGDNYRNKDYLSTNYIISNAKQACKIIIFNNCYFHFYYTDLLYIKFENDYLHKPIDYHFKHIIDCYLNKLSVSDYVNNYVNNVDLLTGDDLDKMANDSLNELQKRYNEACAAFSASNIFVLSIHDFVEQNYKDKLLFYSMNHPSKYLFNYLCEQILEILEISNKEQIIDYNSDPLESIKAIIYKCVQNNVNFDIEQCPISICGESDPHKIALIYYKTYDEIGYDNFKNIVKGQK